MFDYPLLLVFPAAMAFAGAIDLFTMTIPNKVSVALIAAFAVAAAMTGMPWQLLASHVLAGLLFLALGILMFSRGWLGGGDAKLLAAAALWFGFELLLPYLVLVTLMGGALALVIIAYRNILPPVWVMGQGWARRLHDRQGGIPYGVALAGAALWLYPSTRWFMALAA